jgi:hypothetical protein
MFSDFWQWLHNTSPGQATFLGSVFGFLALLGGAWVNAWFNRKRDDRLRREEQRGVATALRTELTGCREVLLRNAGLLKKEDYLAPEEHFIMPDLAHAIRIMPHMIPKLGLLEQETIDKVTNAYLALEEYGDRLLLLGGRLVGPENPDRVSPAATEAQAVGETRGTGIRRLMRLSADKNRQVIALGSGLN